MPIVAVEVEGARIVSENVPCGHSLLTYEGMIENTKTRTVTIIYRAPDWTDELSKAEKREICETVQAYLASQSGVPKSRVKVAWRRDE